jgi:hypothetical protein
VSSRRSRGLSQRLRLVNTPNEPHWFSGPNSCHLLCPSTPMSCLQALATCCLETLASSCLEILTSSGLETLTSSWLETLACSCLEASGLRVRSTARRFDRRYWMRCHRFACSVCSLRAASTPSWCKLRNASSSSPGTFTCVRGGGGISDISERDRRREREV